MKFRALAGVAALALWMVTLASGQMADSFTPARRHPAIDYDGSVPDDPIARLDARMRRGEVSLQFDERTGGYLRSVLDELGMAPESQVLVFSKSSFQAPLINPRNPRALYFSDTAAVGFVRGGEVLELIGQDPRQGAMFYTLAQEPSEAPQFTRNPTCVSCHLSEATFDVPGMFAASMYTGPRGDPLYAPVYYEDHRTPFEQRWGGWYVTGTHGTMAHRGNATSADETAIDPVVRGENQNLRSLDGRADFSGYLSGTSDIVALMVLEHQMHLMNLFTRIGWEHRLATPEAKAMAIPESRAGGVIEATRTGRTRVDSLKLRPLPEAVIHLVDYMLFVDEAPLAGGVQGVSGFAQRFPRQGIRDAKGRSLRDLDLSSRLMRYPLSYMIYSEPFEALPAEIKAAVYQRLWDVLSGAVTDTIYASRLPLADRQAIVEILRDTKPGLPAYFGPVTR
jgi:hypothetical protein